jgi:hypothetical protein
MNILIDNKIEIKALNISQSIRNIICTSKQQNDLFVFNVIINKISRIQRSTLTIIINNILIIQLHLIILIQIINKLLIL